MSILYGDDPLNADHIDILGRERIVKRVVSSLNVIRSRTPSAVAALVGPWGSGKTTLLAQVEDVLTGDGEWQVARYNPWSYPSLETAVPAFFSELRNALPAGTRGSKAREAIGGWLSRLAPAGDLSSVAGPNLSGPAQVIADLVTGDRSPEKLRAEAEELLRELSTPVLMLVDDLDRLGPDELLMTFKLVRLLGRLPNVYYLLSYDEKTLEDLLMRTGLVAQDKSRAREYMEKMVQLRLDIPTMLPDERLTLVNAVLDEVLGNHRMRLSARDLRRMSVGWQKCLDIYINQPRAAKRLFTQVDAAWTDVEGEVDFVDFVHMTFLRTFEPRVYDLVERHSDELLSAGASVLGVKPKETHEQRWDRWIKSITTEGARHPNKVADLLAELFVPLRSARDKMEFGSAAMADIANRRGVGHPDYFYRYTQTGVPVQDIAERTVLASLRELRDDAPGPALIKVEAKLKEDPQLVVSKILRNSPGSELPAEGLMKLLARTYEAMGAKEHGIQASRPSWVALNLAAHVLSETPDDAVALIKASTESAEGLTLVCDLLRQQMRAVSEDQHWRDLIDKVRTHVAELIQADLKAAFAPTADGRDLERAFRNVYALRDLTSEAEVRDLLWALIDREATWNVGDVLAAILPLGMGSTGEDEWITVGDVEAETVEWLLGIEKVASILDVSPAPYGSRRSEARFDNPPTLEERKPLALEGFRHILYYFRNQQS
ncbi:AAA family ATPase [Arthrobacter sp. ISL-48]|uniref:KAP family P-loop NTPase fold protein n=1 Tax=Arthrobacter sp. ISL-48 TaxID=2819110 RepID=UPI001BE65FC8|nr:P-loop NTPase fold protein [Arthrobacter sp. ISL-48]MBT2533937.1 AAA family ATPase [Arthrobacter sp. ISL-48]